MGFETPSLYGLVSMQDPGAVLDEVRAIVVMMFPRFDFEKLHRAYRDVLRLFRGQYPGYQKCDTAYHDVMHTIDTLLAMARLTRTQQW